MNRQISTQLTTLLRLTVALLVVLLVQGVFSFPCSARSTPAIELGDPSPATTLVAQAAPVTVQKVGPIGMTVSDMDRALSFYTKVLPFTQISEVELWGSEVERLQGVFGLRMRTVQLKLGEEVIELTDYLTPEGKPIPIDTRSNDRWFQHIAIVVSDMEKAYQLLRQHHVQYASTGPQKLPETIPAAAGIEAFYFRDPDGHFLEIIHYPAGKGNAKWQQTNDQLFLGIDHTAIVISNTDESLKFYRDGLGLTLAGESENFGNEQEHLNNVFGARLRISGLTSGAGPGIEFLNYLAPSNGRPYPVDAQSNDLLHWQTTVVVKDLAALADRLRQEDASFISPGIVELTDTKLGFQKGFLVRDPDGHVMRIVEQI